MLQNTLRRGFVLAAVLLAGCGTLAERNEIRSAVDDGTKLVQDKLARVREDDRQKGAVVREIDGVWLGGRTVKVARDAELPAVFNQPIQFPLHDRPTLPVIADRLSKIIGMTVRVTPDALIPPEVFAAQRMSGMGGAGGMQNTSMNVAAANGVRMPTVAMAPQNGPIGQYAPSMSMMGGVQTAAMVPARPLILDQMTPFNGTLTELLDLVSSKAGVGWDYKDGTVLISRMVTRTYQVASFIDTNEVSSSISKSGSAGGSGGSSSGGSGGNMTQAGSVTSSSDVSSKTSATMDVAKGLEKAIQGALTPNIGKYSISPSGIVTVTDTREVQEQIQVLIAAENRAVGRQVRVRMQIVDVTATTNNDTGFDWSWVINQATAKWNVNFFAPAGLPGGSSGFGQFGVIRNGDHSTTSAFIQALASVGKVNIRKDETYTLMNNRPHSVANIDNFIYPARTTAATTTTTSTTAIPGVEPGQLTTGTFLNLRAQIQPNGSVIIQFSMDASLRTDLKTFVSNGVTLQYPQSSANQYQAYTTVVSGSTGVLAAIDNTQQQATDKSFDGTLTPLLGGGIATNTTRRAVLVLLTPQIIEGVN